MNILIQIADKVYEAFLLFAGESVLRSVEV